jgi:ABC-type multidrug transport system fused ATPase/permease subunit
MSRLKLPLTVLQDVSISIPRGKVTALVGHSGAGKSTVAALVSRFYEPSAGDILLGGSSVAGFTRGEWAKAVALVSQEPVLFSGEALMPSPFLLTHPLMNLTMALCRELAIAC